jgi:DNA-binding transcriptional MerR regulator
MMLTIKEAAAELRVSKQWLQYWLAANPVDAAGVPFYVPMGNRKRFEPKDIDRIRAYMRDMESARLGLSGKSKARLVGLLSQLGEYDELVKMRERRQPPVSGTASAKLLGELAVASVLGPRTKQPRRRVRLPRFKPKGEG